MVVCSVKGCKNRSDKKEYNAQIKLKFYTFPKNDYYKSRWESACGEKITKKFRKYCQ